MFSRVLRQRAESRIKQRSSKISCIRRQMEKHGETADKHPRITQLRDI